MIKTVYQTAYELETDKVLDIVATRPEREVKRASAKCRRQAIALLNTIETILATLSVVAAVNGDFQSAFIGSSLLLVLIVTGRVAR